MRPVGVEGGLTIEARRPSSSGSSAGMALYELVSRAESGNDADADYPAACQARQGIIAPMGLKTRRVWVI